MVSTNTSEVMVMLAGGIVGIEPLGPLQLLWINVLTDVAPALALALEPAELDIMERPPRNPAEPLFGRADHRRIATEASGMALVSLAAYGFGALLPGGTTRRGRTMSFASLVTAQLLHSRQCRARSSAPNPELAWALVVSLALEAGALGFPFLRNVLRTEKIPLSRASLAFALGALPTVLRTGTAFPWSQQPVIVERAAASNVPRETQNRDEFESLPESPEEEDEQILHAQYEEARR
jgi:Ca2+-transporting ATPase